MNCNNLLVIFCYFFILAVDASQFGSNSSETANKESSPSNGHSSHVSLWEGFKNGISNALSEPKKAIGEVVHGVRNVVSDGFDEAKKGVGVIQESVTDIKDGVSNTMGLHFINDTSRRVDKVNRYIDKAPDPEEIPSMAEIVRVFGLVKFGIILAVLIYFFSLIFCFTLGYMIKESQINKSRVALDIHFKPSKMEDLWVEKCSSEKTLKSNKKSDKKKRIWV